MEKSSKGKVKTKPSQVKSNPSDVSENTKQNNPHPYALENYVDSKKADEKAEKPAKHDTPRTCGSS
jgi:predicted homoserine dehydrogenase-like protein